MPSNTSLVKLIALAAIVAGLLFPGGRLKWLVVPAFLVFGVATVVSMRQVSRHVDVKGLKRLRDIFPKK